MKKFFLLLLLAAVATMPGLSQNLPWPAESLNPDSYGYTWKTNSAPGGPQYNWIEIVNNGLGTEVQGIGDDDFKGPFQLGFDFQYYWVTRSEIYIGSNGYVAFEPGNIASTGVGFPKTPTSAGPNDVIAPFMCDLSPVGPGNPGRIFYYADTDNERFIVTYDQMPFWTNNPAGWDGLNSFQVILDGQDSTVTFQYQLQVGQWNASYNDTPYPMVVGIENLLGTVGLFAIDDVAPNTVGLNDLPVGNTAIRFYAPTNPTLAVRDAGVEYVQNADLGGFFVPWEPPGSSPNVPSFNLTARITNFGNRDLTGTIQYEAEVVDTTGQIAYIALDSIPGGLAAGASQDVVFDIPFVPPTARPYIYSVEITNAFALGDINSTNNVRNIEAIVIDTTEAEVAFTYASNNPANIDGLVSWTGNNEDSGLGTYYESYGYPVDIKYIDVYLLSGQNFNPNGGGNSHIVQIHGVDTVNGNVPGPLLFSDTLTVTALFTPTDSSVYFTADDWARSPVDPPVTIEGDGFYVSWLQSNDDLFIATESAEPISRRSFEILGGFWSNWRTNAIEDAWIRPIVDIQNAIPVSNVPKVTLFREFSVYPNPVVDDQLNFALALGQPQDLNVALYDLSGRKVALRLYSQVSSLEAQWDLSALPAGMYLLRATTREGAATKRILKR
jgi:hypothetical protein